MCIKTKGVKFVCRWKFFIRPVLCLVVLYCFETIMTNLCAYLNWQNTNYFSLFLSSTGCSHFYYPSPLFLCKIQHILTELIIGHCEYFGGEADCCHLLSIPTLQSLYVTVLLWPALPRYLTCSKFLRHCRHITLIRVVQNKAFMLIF
jgi:hypothetical protein